MVEAEASADREAEEIRVLVADDHPVVRDGLRAMLDEPGINVVGEASTGQQAVDRDSSAPERVRRAMRAVRAMISPRPDTVRPLCPLSEGRGADSPPERGSSEWVMATPSGVGVCG